MIAACRSWLLLLAALAVTPCNAGGGPLPLVQLDEERYARLAADGLRISAQDLRDLARTVVRIEGPAPASGLLVSQDGLVLISYGTVTTCLEAIAASRPDVLVSGFVAYEREDERPCPGLKASLAAPGDEPPFRVGGVRLVHAPEQALARFGGAGDDLRWPRQRADYAIVRLVPAGPPDDAEAVVAAGAFGGLYPAPIATLGLHRGAPAFVLVAGIAAHDASLRLSWGIVDGYVPRGGVGRLPYATTVADLFARAGDDAPYRLSETSLAQLGGVRIPAFVDRLLQDVPVAFVIRAALDGGAARGAPVVDGTGQLAGIHSGAVGGASAPAHGNVAVVTDVRFILDLLIRRYAAIELARELGL